jgi:hypothetical protein
MKTEKLCDLIRTFALKRPEPFEFDALVEFVRKKAKAFDPDRDADRLYDLACESEFLFADRSEIFRERFMPRHLFFKGAEFRVNPLKEEVEGGFLIPGHRLMPFAAREVFPPDACLKLPDGSQSAIRTIQLPSELAHRFLLFFGQYSAIDYLVADHESNDKSLRPPFTADVAMTAFDLRGFFKQCGFSEGDSLLFTVEDWMQGVYSVRHLPAQSDPPDFVRIRDWVHALRLGFEEARQEADLRQDCQEQMARMLWYATTNEETPPVLSNPPLSMSAFFNTQEGLTLQSAGQTVFFWPEDAPVDSRIMNSLATGPAEPENRLDTFFQWLGLSVHSEEVEAYMRDALARNETNPDNVLARVIQGRTLRFETVDEQREFKRLWNQLWRDVRKTYNPKTDECRELRTVFLDLNDQCLQVLREMDRDSADPFAVMTHPAAMQLHELSSLISSALVFCNKTDGDTKEFPLPLGQIAHDMSSAIRELSDRLRNHDFNRTKDIADGTVYQLKISLKYSRPPIWRRVLVPATIELEHLHEVIQTVFGWTNSHLHQFIDGETFYQPGAENDGFSGMRNEDSAGIRLQDLLRKEKDRIVYEYDFGDSWEHDILLEKVLADKPEPVLPVCVKGKGACPPEDCGGLPGYYQMLGVLSGPDSSEKKEILDWFGGTIDPEAFDLAAVNERLGMKS